MAPTLKDLNQMLNAVEAHIVLCEAANDPEKRAQLEARRSDIQQRILDHTHHVPRLPYGDQG